MLYIEDQTGAFDWVNSDHVFDFITELLRPIGVSGASKEDDAACAQAGLDAVKAMLR